MAPISPLRHVRRPTPLTWVSVAVALLLWASAFAGIRAGLAPEGGVPGRDGFGPGELALLRFGTASLALAAFALFRPVKLPRRQDLPRIAAAALTGITIYHLALNFGERTVASGAAAFLIALSPVFTAALATRFLGERLTRWGWLGFAVSLVGGAVVAFGEGEGVGFDSGAGLILLATVSTAVYFFLAKPLLDHYSAFDFTAYSIWAGTAPMLLFAPSLVAQVGVVPREALLSGIYLGVFPGALAYVLWSGALARMPASRLSAFLYSQPLNAAVIAWIWLREIPAPAVFVGGLVSMGGVVLVNRYGHAQSSVHDEERS